MCWGRRNSCAPSIQHTAVEPDGSMPTSGQRNRCITERERETVLSVVYSLRLNKQLSTGPTVQHSIARWQHSALCCKDKEMTNTEAMHQHVNVMTKNKVERLHLVSVNEWEMAITLTTINGNPPRWRVKVKVKVMQSHYRPGPAQRVPRS